MVDRNLKELTEHRTVALPVACYETIINQNVHGYIPLHWHDELQFILVIKGQSIFQVNGENIVVGEGEGLFINSGCLHMAKDMDDSNCAYICLNVSPSFILSQELYATYVTPYIQATNLSYLQLHPNELWGKNILDAVRKIIMSPSFDDVQALKQHREKLLAERRRLEALIANVEKTLLAKEGRIIMSDKEKFEAFKQQLIDENERNYGKEIREKYGEEQVNKANEKVKNMTQAQYEEVTKLGEEVLRVLHEAFLTGDPAGELAQKAADLHRQWLGYFWDHYSKEAHAGLAQMYVDDERFKAYYDQKQPGTAEFFREAIFIYTGKK